MICFLFQTKYFKSKISNLPLPLEVEGRGDQETRAGIRES